MDRRAPDVAASTDEAILKLQAYYAQNKAQCPLAEELEEAAETPDRLGQLDALEQEIAAIETAISESRREQRELHAKRRTVAESAQAVESVAEKLKEEKKIKERTHILLENPEVNVAKLESIIAAAGEKMKKLQSQWEAHRAPLVATLEEHQAKNSDQVVRWKANRTSTRACAFRV